ncbi:DUF3237 domain-containing protein [Parasedimentitalea psychrophila]|uniref:DUF3237 domain-containing protein n=1 Tax=Parasedimentitalea psychrophila TaxID=2997337 RepID=A0A9Y2KUZ0_9RHOB|nr:DUF3237 domain-containing protein [Parasedimentitalea psychrophila]WIY23630.1 DUF3237 domain-containing protein [Parasedimentitalea psychrophila]
MSEYTANGLTLHWSEPVIDAARGMQRVVVKASPSDPANVLRIIYAQGNGPEGMIRGWPTGSDTETGLQTFAADLPRALPGKKLRWRPVLTSGIREADPGRGWQEVEPPASPRPPTDTKPFKHRLEFFARATAPLDPNPIVIGDTPDGLHIVYPLAKGGTVIGPRINGVYDQHGGDWMRIRSDGMGVVGVRAVLRTSDGANLLTEYSGLVDFGRDGQKRLLSGDPPPQAEACLTPRFVTAHPDWLWINRLQMIAFGRVTFATLLVEYDLYIMHSEATNVDEENA